MARCGPAPQKSQLERSQEAYEFTARVIPLLLIGIVGYTAWVIVVNLCAHYLIHSEHGADHARPAAGIVIIVLYCVFFLAMAFSYFRILSTVRQPGFIEKGTPTDATVVKEKKVPEKHVQRSCLDTKVKEQDPGSAGATVSDPQPVTMLNIKSILSGEVLPPPGTERFFSKDVFICDPNGLPIWCGTCCNWKSDRAHHCSDVGRCVYKLDHFCPWVGGVVGERNFNFFIQFTCYTALFSLFVMIVMAIFVAEQKRNGNELDVNWIVVLALSAFFTLFTAGMAITSIGFMLKNLTTIDNIGHQKKTMHLAVLINDPMEYRSFSPPSTIGQTDGSHSADPTPWRGTITYPLCIDTAAPSGSSHSTSTIVSKSQPPQRTFAILQTHPGMNPWNLGAFQNFKSIMGDHWYDWFLPLRHSPCCNHDSGDSMYALGPDVERLKLDAGLVSPARGSTGGSSRRRRRRRQSNTHRRDEDIGNFDPTGSTLANVNGVTGRENASRRDFDGEREVV